MAKEPTWKKRAKEDNDLFREKPKHPNKKLEMALPLPPSVNALYVNTRGGGRRLTRTAENYIRTARALINMNIDDQGWIVPSQHTWLYIDMVIYMPDRKVRDSHNMLKLLLDVLQGTAYINDYAVMPRIQSVEYDPSNPRIEIDIKVQTKSNREKSLKTANAVV